MVWRSELKRKKFLFVFIILIALIFMIEWGLDYMDSKTTYFLGIMFTDSTMPDSEYVMLNNNGAIKDSINIKGTGIFQIVEDDEKNLLFPEQFNNKLFKMNSERVVTTSEIKNYPLYMEVNNNTKVTLYNTGFNYGTLEIVKNNNTLQRKLDGLLNRCTFDDKHIYVRGEIYDLDSGEFNRVLYVIDIDTLEIVKKIELENISLCNFMEIIQNKLYIGSSPIDSTYEQDLLVVNLSSWEVEYIKLNTDNKIILSGPALDIVLYNNMLHIIHYGGDITILDINSHKINTIVTIPQETVSVIVDDDKAFVLSQVGEEGQDALVGVYNFPEWKLQNKWVVGKIRKMRPQTIYLNN